MSKIKVLAGLISSEALLLNWQTAVSLPCPHVVFALCTHTKTHPGVSSSSYKDASQTGLGLHPNNFVLT